MSSEGCPTLGFGIDTDPALTQFNPLNLFEGRWPAADDEVVIDAGTADEQGYEVGDTVEISTLQPKRAFELVGVAKYGERRQPRERELRRVHDSGGAGAARPRGAVRRDLGRRRRRASPRTSSSRRSQPVLPGEREGRERDRRGGGAGGRGERVHVDLPLLPARLRRASRSSSARSSSSTPSRSRSRSGRASSRRCGRSARRGGRCSAR